ncbi:MAG: prolipoprotein diacylglyceryl transferase [Actinomycetia bacterium]|nr:prolipoprotein diacylglyceryl transferase [Actinomycetes bacterium]
MHPVLIKIGPFIIYSYGFFLALAFLAVLIIGRKELQRKGHDADLMYDLVLWTAVGGIIGARIFYVAYNWDVFTVAPIEALFLWNGGLALYGGIIGSITAVLILVYVKNLQFGMVADIAGICAPLGIAIGRIGCLFNGCCYGRITSKPWGLIFPEIDNFTRHPTQIYEIIYALAIFAFIWFIRKRIYTNGDLFFLFILLYSIFRFLNEFLRVNPDFIFGMSGSQIVSIMFFIASSIFFLNKFYLKYRFKNSNQSGNKKEQ